MIGYVCRFKLHIGLFGRRGQVFVALRQWVFNSEISCRRKEERSSISFLRYHFSAGDSRAATFEENLSHPGELDSDFALQLLSFASGNSLSLDYYPVWMDGMRFAVLLPGECRCKGMPTEAVAGKPDDYHLIDRGGKYLARKPDSS